MHPYGWWYYLSKGKTREHLTGYAQTTIFAGTRTREGSDMTILKRVLLVTALAVSVAAPSRAQDRADTQRSGDEQVTINASEVQVDLVVKDKKYRLVKDLEPGDIEVYEDGVRQDLKSLRLVNGGS